MGSFSWPAKGFLVTRSRPWAVVSSFSWDKCICIEGHRRSDDLKNTLGKCIVILIRQEGRYGQVLCHTRVEGLETERAMPRP